MSSDPAPSASPGTQRLILQATVGVALGTVVVRLLGLFKSQVVAAGLGVSAELDAFLFASILPTFAIGVLTNALATALVPLLASLRARGGRAGEEPTLRLLSGWCLVVLVGVALALAFLWPLFLRTAGAELAPAKQALATRLFYLLLPSLILHGAASFWSAVLNADKRFLGPVVAPGFVPLSIAAAVLLAPGEPTAYALALGHVAGVALEFLFLALATRRQGHPLAPVRPRRSPEVASFLAQYRPVLAGSLLMSSTTLVDQSMGAWLTEGSLAQLFYGNVVVQAVLGVGATALGTAVLPYFSDMAAAGATEEIRRALRTWSGVVLALGCPLALGLALLASPLAALLFERGAFGAADTRAVGLVLAMYALQIPFYALGTLYARVLASLRANQVFARVALWNVVANAGFNLALMPALGAAGIALSTSIVYLSSAVFLGLAVRRRLAVAEA